MDINAIRPYENNARHNDKAVPKVAESIKEFGLRGQIVLESHDNPVIVAGHTRWAACKLLGWTEIPDDKLDYCEDLTQEQIKAFRLADNRLGEISTWDVAKLKKEIRSMNGSYDMSRFNFDFKSNVKPYGAERQRTGNTYNLDIVDKHDCTGMIYGMPELEACDYIPDELIGFNYVKQSQEFDKTVHFFLDDYQFERIWNNPKENLERLKKFKAVLTPDFSLYADMPLPMQIWNIYRARALGRYWQNNGLTVIPTLSWSTPDSYDFAVEGIPLGSTVAVSTVGVLTSDESLDLFKRGLFYMLEQVQPTVLLMYGKRMKNLRFKKSLEVKYFENTKVFAKKE